MREHTVTMLEDDKLEEKREEFLKMYKETFGFESNNNIEFKAKTVESNKKVKVSINIFGIKANI